MSEQHIPKPSGNFRSSFFIKLGIICLGIWLSLNSCLDDGFSSVEGQEAIEKIRKNIRIPPTTVKNANFAIYAKGFMPADPNMFMRFEVDRLGLDTYIKNNKLKAKTEDSGTCVGRASHRSLGDWWQPSKISSKVCFTWNAENTDYYMTFENLNSKVARVYVFGYNN